MHVRGTHLRTDSPRPLPSISQTISAALYAIMLVGGVFAALASGQFAAICFTVTLGALSIMLVIALLRGRGGSSAGESVYSYENSESYTPYTPYSYTPSYTPSYSYTPPYTPIPYTPSSYTHRPLTAREASHVSPTSGFTSGHF